MVPLRLEPEPEPKLEPKPNPEPDTSNGWNERIESRISSWIAQNQNALFWISKSLFEQQRAQKENRKWTNPRSRRLHETAKEQKGVTIGHDLQIKNLKIFLLRANILLNLILLKELNIQFDILLILSQR